MKMIKEILFKTLAAMNKTVLPSYTHAQLEKLNGFQKLIIAYRIWVTKNVLD